MRTKKQVGATEGEKKNGCRERRREGRKVGRNERRTNDAMMAEVRKKRRAERRK